MSKRIILVGKGGSGKDYMRKLLENKGFRYCISHTSRPIREGEEEGKDYWYTNNEHFENNPDDFYEMLQFAGYYYGTSNEEFNKSNLFIMTPGGIRKLKPEDRLESVIVYIDIDEETRGERLSKRKDFDKVDRRLEADYEDFKDFSTFDLRITNPFFTEKDAVMLFDVFHGSTV